MDSPHLWPGSTQNPQVSQCDFDGFTQRWHLSQWIYVRPSCAHRNHQMNTTFELISLMRKEYKADSI